MKALCTTTPGLIKVFALLVCGLWVALGEAGLGLKLLPKIIALTPTIYKPGFYKK